MRLPQVESLVPKLLMAKSPYISLRGNGRSLVKQLPMNEGNSGSALKQVKEISSLSLDLLQTRIIKMNDNNIYYDSASHTLNTYV